MIKLYWPRCSNQCQRSLLNRKLYLMWTLLLVCWAHWQPVTKSLSQGIRINWSMTQSNASLRSLVSLRSLDCLKIVFGNKEQNRTCKLSLVAKDFLVSKTVETSRLMKFTVTQTNKASSVKPLLRAGVKPNNGTTKWRQEGSFDFGSGI